MTIKIINHQLYSYYFVPINFKYANPISKIYVLILI